MNRLKSIAAISLLVISSLVVSALALEGWLAIARINTKSIVEYTPGKGSTYLPGAYYRSVEEGFSEGYINSHGFRDYERTVEKPDKTFRILVLGNSYAEAFQVPLQDSFTAVLERKLNENSPHMKFEVLNLGQSGFVTADEYARYLNVGVRYSPDLVLLAFVTGTDIPGSSRTFNSEMSHFFHLEQQGDVTLDESRFIDYDKTYTFSRRAFQALKQRSYLASLISEWLFKLRFQQRQQILENALTADAKTASPATLPETSGMNIYKPELSAHWKEAFALTEAGLRKMRDTVQANGSQFLLVTLTNAEQVHPDLEKQIREEYDEAFDFDQPERIIAEFAGKDGINCLELLPGFREYHLRTGKYLHGFGSGKGGHWNETGHRLAAEMIFEFLKEKHMVPLG